MNTEGGIMAAIGNNVLRSGIVSDILLGFQDEMETYVDICAEVYALGQPACEQLIPLIHAFFVHWCVPYTDHWDRTVLTDGLPQPVLIEHGIVYQMRGKPDDEYLVRVVVVRRCSAFP